MLFDIGDEDFLTVLELPGGQDHDYTVQAGWTAQTADGSQSWLSIENMGLILAVTLLCIFVPPLLFFDSPEERLQCPGVKPNVRENVDSQSLQASDQTDQVLVKFGIGLRLGDVIWLRLAQPWLSIFSISRGIMSFMTGSASLCNCRKAI